MAIFAVFVAKFLSPIPIVVAIIGAFWSRAWWHVAITAVVAATIGEVLLSATQVTRSFNPAIFLIGVLAAGVWAALAFWIKRVRMKK